MFALGDTFPRLAGLLLNAWLEENGVPSFAKAELSKLRFWQKLECRRVVAAQVSMLAGCRF
jgi:hypothetical protein